MIGHPKNEDLFVSLREKTTDNPSWLPYTIALIFIAVRKCSNTKEEDMLALRVKSADHCISFLCVVAMDLVYQPALMVECCIICLVLTIHNETFAQ